MGNMEEWAMQSKRDGLMPVAEVLSDLNGPVAAIRDTSPQALHHFTQADQVNQLVSASEADPRIRARLAQNTIDLPNLPGGHGGWADEVLRSGAARVCGFLSGPGPVPGMSRARSGEANP